MIIRLYRDGEGDLWASQKLAQEYNDNNCGGVEFKECEITISVERLARRMLGDLLSSLKETETVCDGWGRTKIESKFLNQATELVTSVITSLEET
jgi:hypothetical protein